jgi:hypothetical protein
LPSRACKNLVKRRCINNGLYRYLEECFGNTVEEWFLGENEENMKRNEE